MSFTQLDTDRAIFDKEVILAEILANSSIKELQSIVETITDEMSRLKTMKKTLMSENYSKFILVDNHLKRLRQNLVAAVAGMEKLQEEIEKELDYSPDQ